MAPEFNVPPLRWSVAVMFFVFGNLARRTRNNQYLFTYPSPLEDGAVLEFLFNTSVYAPFLPNLSSFCFSTSTCLR